MLTFIMWFSLFDLLSSHNEQERNDASSPRKLLPRPFPSATILPIFNSMAYFIVKPGESFHSVQEVFADEPRLSIQGNLTSRAFVMFKCNTLSTE